MHKRLTFPHRRLGREEDEIRVLGAGKASIPGAPDQGSPVESLPVMDRQEHETSDQTEKRLERTPEQGLVNGMEVLVDRVRPIGLGGH